MAELKTKKQGGSITGFLSAIENEQRKKDSFELLGLFETITGMAPALWGDSIVGFGEYHYTSGRSKQRREWPLTGFSPRKQNMAIYVMPGFAQYQDLLAVLGQHKTGVSCLYFTKLQHIDTAILADIIQRSVAEMKKNYAWE